MDSYVLNKRSGVLHKLPASESCNTDQIQGKQRFEVHVLELPVIMIDGSPFRYCKRCFPHDSD